MFYTSLNSKTVRLFKTIDTVKEINLHTNSSFFGIFPSIARDNPQAITSLEVSFNSQSLPINVYGYGVEDLKIGIQVEPVFLEEGNEQKVVALRVKQNLIYLLDDLFAKKYSVWYFYILYYSVITIGIIYGADTFVKLFVGGKANSLVEFLIGLISVCWFILASIKFSFVSKEQKEMEIKSLIHLVLANDNNQLKP